jgi:hypothetical protein
MTNREKPLLVRIAEKNGMRYVTDSAFPGRNMSIYAIKRETAIGVAWHLTAAAEATFAESRIGAT